MATKRKKPEEVQQGNAELERNYEEEEENTNG